MAIYLVDSESGERIPFDHSIAGAIGERISAAMADVEKVPELGRNTQGGGYNYARATDVKAEARRVLAKHGISVIPSMNDVRREVVGTTRSGNDWIRTTIPFTFMLCAEEGAIMVQWYGEGLDTGDKGINKSATTAEKYFLINLLMLDTGNEPDADAETPAPTNRRSRPQEPQPEDIPPPQPSDAMKRKFHAVGKELYADQWDTKRAEIVGAVTKDVDRTSANDLTAKQMNRLISLMEEHLANGNGENDTEPARAGASK